MYLLTRNNDRFLGRLLTRCMGDYKKSYYEVLNVPRTCSDKDIKQAFIRMSKKLHPDRNNGGNTHDAFVRVLEAYSVLGKPASRAQYDNVRVVHSYTAASASAASAAASTTRVYRDTAGTYGRRTGERTFYSDFYEYRDKSQDAYNESKPYYGFAGDKKRSNMTIVAICLGITFVAVLMQLFIISASFSSGRRLAIEKSMKNARDLDDVRKAAAENGNEVQARLLLKKIGDASSPSIATATFAHELVSNKPK